MNIQAYWFQSDKGFCELWTDTERHWLTSSGSLTQNLRRVTKGRIEHGLLNESFEIPQDEELVYLAAPREKTWVREINWSFAGKLWVAARVIIPSQTLEGGGLQLKEIGRRSLGEVLFSDPNLRRSDFEFAQITKQHPYYSQISQHVSEKDRVWARRSIFYFDKKPLLVSEIFLPELFSNVTLLPEPH